MGRRLANTVPTASDDVSMSTAEKEQAGGSIVSVAAVLDAARTLGSGGDPTAPQARAYLANYLSSLPDGGGLGGYRWSLVLDDVNPAALRDRVYGLHVLLLPRDPGGNVGLVPALPHKEGRIDMVALRQLPGYCGSNAGFNTVPQHGLHDRVRN
jgi:hypothetical protein